MKKMLIAALMVSAVNTFAFEATSCDVRLEVNGPRAYAGYNAVVAELESKGYNVVDTEETEGLVTLTMVDTHVGSSNMVATLEVTGLRSPLDKNNVLYRRADDIALWAGRAARKAARLLEKCEVAADRSDSEQARMRRRVLSGRTTPGYFLDL